MIADPRGEAAGRRRPRTTETLVATPRRGDLRRRLLLGRRQPRRRVHRGRVPRLPVRLLPPGAAGGAPSCSARDGDIRLIVKEMPILGPGSELAARAAVATLITEGPETLRRAARPADGAARAQITDASLDQALTESGLDPAAIRAGDGRPGGRAAAGGDPGAGREARDLRHADLRLRQPDGARLPAARADARRWSARSGPPTERGRTAGRFPHFPARAAPNIQWPDPERGQAAAARFNKNRAHMSKRPQESDVEFIRALAELLRENDLTEIEVNRDYGEEDALTVRVARQVAADAPRRRRRRRCRSLAARPPPRRPPRRRPPPTRPRTRASCPRRWSAPPTCRPSPRRPPS